MNPEVLERLRRSRNKDVQALLFHSDHLQALLDKLREDVMSVSDALSKQAKEANHLSGLLAGITDPLPFG